MAELKDKIKGTVSSVLPITCVVSLLSITITLMPVGIMLPFTCGAVMLVIDMELSSLGADVSMMLMGEGIGTMLSTSEKRCLMVCITFVIGFIITIAEPDLTVLIHQVPGIPDNTLIWTVATGIGFLLAMVLPRILFHRDLKYLFMLFYALVFMLAYFSMDTLMVVAFDSGGVIVGPITIPLLMALGIGMTNVAQRHAEEESFGIVALCSIGPVPAVLLLGILYEPQGAIYTPFEMAYMETGKDVTRIFLTELSYHMWEVNKALPSTLYFSPLLRLISSYFDKRVIIKILVGALYTFLGLTPFLCGVNIGFMPVGYFIGTQITALSYNQILIPIGMPIGFFIVRAEPAVHVLTRQVRDILSGIILAETMLYSLPISVGISFGTATLRILSCISIMAPLIPRYLTAIILSFFIPNVFTGIAFDSGGVAGDPMTAAFLPPFAMGACEQLEGNVLLGVFSIVTVVAMIPLLTIQIPSLVMTKHKKTAAGELQEDSIMESEEAIDERTEN